MLVDAHAHVDKYGEDIESALAEIRQIRVLTTAVSMDVESYQSARSLARKEPLITPGFGIHPWNAPMFVGSLSQLLPYVSEAPVIGEIGLDYHFVKDASSYPAQRKVFDFLLDSASRLGKPVNLHTKGAERDVVDRIAAHSGVSAVVHWYSGPVAEMDRLLDLGAYFTVGVALLHSSKVDEIAQRIPPERVLTETDNPGGWSWLSGTPGYPRLLLQVLDRLAQLRAVARDDLVETIAANYDRLMRATRLRESDPDSV
jgi:TatD DNase family protein